MPEYLTSIANGLIAPITLGLIKIYSDLGVLKAEHKALQTEVNELKDNIKDNDTKLDKRFDKLEALIEKLYLYERGKND